MPSYLSKNLGWDPLVLTPFFSEPLDPPKRLLKRKGKVDGVVSVYAQRSGILTAQQEVAEAVPLSTAKNSSSSKLINRSFPLNMLNSTCGTSDVTRGQERLLLIRKKPPIWHCKPSSTASTASMATTSL